ncbi:MAG TPA: hypothetical protein VEL07_12570 [Planctomycetota bacterium]|nr:hypothetical protein [Planctomycetota bacterium]
MRTWMVWLVLGILCVAGSIALRRHREALTAQRVLAEEQARAAAAASAPVEAPVDAPAAIAAPAPAPTPAAPQVSATAALVETQADGTRLIDRRFVLAGQGTAAAPFTPAWDLLLSAQETYAPAAGSWALPPRLDLLDGKTVQIIGHMTTLVHAQVTDRLLLTWAPLDGCHGQAVEPCQGIEVQLDQPVDYDPHAKIVLTIVGTFALDPRRERGWKATVYRLDHARIVAFEDPRTR